MPQISANGINIHYEMQGEGVPLVLIAGLGYPAWQWHRMTPYLDKDFKVIAFDNRGVGGTDKPTGPYTARLLADDTAAFLDALNIRSGVVMGHSMGGFIAQELALSHADKVSKLILSSTNFGGPHHVPVTPEAMAVLSDMTSDPITRFKNGLVVSTAPGFADKHPEIIQEWLEWRMANPLDLAGYQAQMAIGLGLISEAASFEHRLTEIHIPTLILFGAHDKVVPPANAELLAAKIHDSKVVILPDAGHFFPMEVPQAAAQVIIDFVKQEV
jgi:pimeloyl-ACP methyl ester carboxylesterase